MYKDKCLIFITIIAGAMILAGCSGISDKQGTDSEVLELRSYEVPPEYASEINSIVNSLLNNVSALPGTENSRIGRARLGPGNLLHVTAPASIHTGIEKMLADLKDSELEPTPMVTLTYWFVIGREGSTSWPDKLNGISPALNAITESEGDMKFVLQEKIRIQSISGESARLAGRSVSVSQTTTIRGNRVLADINIGFERDVFNTTIQAELGKLLVLGQRSVEASRPGGSEEVQATLFVIVQASSD